MTDQQKVMTSVDPRGLVDTAPEQQVNPETSQVAQALAAGSLLSTLTELNLKKAGLLMATAALPE